MGRIVHDGKMMPVVVMRGAAVNGCLGDPHWFRSRLHHGKSLNHLEVAETPRKLRLLVALREVNLVVVVVNDLPYVEVLDFGTYTEVPHPQ